MANDQNAFIKYGAKAREEHITFTATRVPGFLTFKCDVDVYLGLWEKTAHAGTYYLREGDDIQKQPVYMMTVDAEHPYYDGEEPKYEETKRDDGTVVKEVKSETSLKVTMEPIEIERGHYLYFLEYLAWLAMTVAESDEIRTEIFNAAYNLSVKEETPRQDGKKPERRYDPTTKLYQTITDPEIYDLVLEVNAAGRGEKKAGKKAVTAISLEYVGDSDDVKLSRPVDGYDMLILSGVIAQLEAGRTMFTASDVFEAVTGSGNPNRKQVEEYTESLDRMRFTKATVDMTSEIQAHKLTDPDTGEELKSGKVETYLLNASKIEIVSVNGRKVEGYLLNEEPILYTHARMTKQIISYPIKYLETKDVGSNTRQNTLIKNYLIDRIMRAKKGKLSPCIRYATVYERAGVDKDNRVTRKRANDYIAGLLKKWKREGVIGGYEIQKEGQQVAKATVYFGS